MKITIAFILLSGLQVSAKTYSQERITIKLQSTELKTALKQIEKKTIFRFLYNDEIVSSNQKVSINAVNTLVTEVLDNILTATNLTYRVLENNLVVITKKGFEVQDISVSGKVTGASGEALPGITVSVKGSAAGTSTNAAGTYSLSVPEGATLVFSSVGFETQEIALDGRTEINVVLITAAKEIEQVVVVGYGTARKKDLTGSVTSIKGADIAKQPVQTATQAIQGKVAGVQIISSGEPNSLPTVRVRGTGTMLGGANPLYVVDGVITDDIRNINSADIVTLDVLKDASATAIYGMRAANGVLIITTKKGRVGKMIFSYDANAGVREATSLVNMAGENQYAGYLNEASVYYAGLDSLVPSAKLQGYNTDWYDVILRKAFQQNHNLSLSGGTDKVNYFLSAGLLAEDGIMVNNKYNRFTIRSNNDYKLTSKLKLSTLVSYSRSDAKGANFGAFSNAYRAAPFVPSKINDLYGNTSAAGNVGNPLLDIEKLYDKVLGNRIQGTFALEYKIIPSLTFRSSMGVDLDFTKSTGYDYKFLSDATTFITPGGNQSRGNSKLRLTNNDANKWVWDNTATFSKVFDKHSLSVLGGITAEQFKFNSVVSSALDVPMNNEQWFINAGTNGSQTVSNTGDKWTRNSFLGRVNYSFNSRYLLTATMRADGTSRFGKDNRWGYFPSVGLGWNISEEGFMKDQGIFNNLKLRGSWGRVGNDNIPTSLYYSIATTNVPYYYDATRNRYLGISFDNVTDKNVKWEVTDEFDIGLDFSILDRKLTGEIDYYQKKTNDALIYVNIPAILGDPDGKYITNAANFENKGIELGLTWSDKIGKDWNYSISGNVAKNKNQILNLNGGQALFDGQVGDFFTTKSDNGQPIGTFFLLQADGIFQNAAEIAKSAQLGAKPGDLRYRDISGAAGIPDGKIDDNDRAFSGSYLPKITYGINGNVGYKKFDLGFNSYGTSGSKIYNGKKAIRGTAATDNIETSVAIGRWTPNRPSNTIPRANLDKLPASTYFLESGDFFRLNNLTIGYSLGGNVAAKAKINSLRVYVTAQNLFTITPYSGFTPEIYKGDGTPLNGGIELNTYPSTRTFAFGVNLGF
ncbi:MAG: TonB-dependent receptor [Ferruginibacter sp.]|nr:TonB-dependent receptor [Ferruginibacter sp.]